MPFPGLSCLVSAVFAVCSNLILETVSYLMVQTQGSSRSDPTLVMDFNPAYGTCCTARAHRALHLAEAQERGRELMVNRIPCYETFPGFPESSCCAGVLRHLRMEIWKNMEERDQCVMSWLVLDCIFCCQTCSTRRIRPKHGSLAAEQCGSLPNGFSTTVGPANTVPGGLG